MGRVTIGATQLDDIDLSIAKGLDTVKHTSRSSIGFDTIIRSQGCIPEIFLRGVGVSDIFIIYSRSLINTPIDYYTCFISYSSHDEILASWLHADLQDRGVRCWFAPEDMKIGDKLRSRMDEAIHLYEKLLLILSKHSMESSWVEQEVETALAKEQKEHRELPPI